MDEEFADIVFEVEGQTVWVPSETKTSETKTSLVTRFPAHQLILRNCSSSTLAELSRSTGDKTTPIQIPDVSPDLFFHLLFHLYGGKVDEDDMKSHAKDILDAADRYGFVDLKLVAEACLVETTAFSIGNLKDLLLYADSKNCALLKEAAIDFMLENRDEVRKKISFNDAPGALINDVLAAFERMEKKGGLSGMGINDLRWHAHWRAHENDFDEDKLNEAIDGSREMSIAALEEDSARRIETHEELEEDSSI